MTAKTRSHWKEYGTALCGKFFSNLYRLAESMRLPKDLELYIYFRFLNIIVFQNNITVFFLR